MPSLYSLYEICFQYNKLGLTSDLKIGNLMLVPSGGLSSNIRAAGQKMELYATDVD